MALNKDINTAVVLTFYAKCAIIIEEVAPAISL
jgi:hypothetical protein